MTHNLFASAGGPAAPIRDGDTVSIANKGLTKRDWFAGQALAGLMASRSGQIGMRLVPEAMARECYAVADAMLAEREKEGG